MLSFTVGELLAHVEAVLEDAFADELWVTGEITDLTRSPNGHVYFTLVEPSDTPGRTVSGKVPVVLFESQRRAVNRMLTRTGSVRMTAGVRIRARGTLRLYPPSGRIQLRMTGIDPAYTLGQLAAERERILRDLARAGLLERNAGLRFPVAPERIGLITSAASAAAADFLDELRASAVSWQVILADTRVQGPGADTAIAAALNALVSRRVEVIAVVRGGGAQTDLAVFDSEALARAIAVCPVPVLTGIGHEIDTSIADAVAHASHKTPTACAAALGQHVIGRQRDAEQTAAAIGAAGVRALGAARSLVGRRAIRVAGATGRRFAGESQRLSTAVTRLDHLSNHAVGRAGTSVTSYEDRVRALDPQRVLERGWSITTDTDGRALRDLATLEVGDEIVTRLARGSVASTVRAVDPEPEQVTP